jgi:hypothetical protein
VSVDPQVQANQYVTTFEHPSFGPTQVVGIPVGLSETPGRLRRPAPEFGQHTEEILAEVLGYSWEDVAVSAAPRSSSEIRRPAVRARAVCYTRPPTTVGKRGAT